MPMMESSRRRRNNISLVLQNQIIQTIRKRKDSHKCKRVLSPKVQRKLRPVSPQHRDQLSPHFFQRPQETDLEKAKKYEVINEDYRNLISKIQKKLKLSNYKNRRFLSPNILRFKANIIAHIKKAEQNSTQISPKNGERRKKKYMTKFPILHIQVFQETTCFNI
ncbi:unnamed protein product [Moneuplotes crassus]|uniref:Uncharacterized protein n=1 Tax=Euplotes crassus TaxID=5936 RepID=A0AAD1XQQ0_EUPCR|nr:unnamed protein product [Moneuplotes crassus]